MNRIYQAGAFAIPDPVKLSAAITNMQLGITKSERAILVQQALKIILFTNLLKLR